MSTTTPKAKITPCTLPGAVLSGDTWSSRVQAFTQSNKYTVLNKRIQDAVNNDLVAIFKLDLNGFMALLGQFQAPKYNGLRMHFACFPDDPNASDFIPDGMEGQLTVFFCPTTPPAKEGEPTGIDDTSQFWFLQPEGNPIQLPAGLTKSWIQNYRDNRKDVLQQDGDDHMKPNKFTETERLWYSMDTIAGGHGVDGLLPYLACQTSPTADNPIIELYIQLSAFTTMDAKQFPVYQLSSVFYFRQASDPVPDPSGLTGAGMEHAIVFGSASLPDRVIPADTGIPCPPANNCPPPGS
ncbi:MAG TPA: hypothetical protein VGS79_17960 [Puia sp.]|nr:hypothetical protein [Puia sp.]